jgi:hypothetical protein
VKDTVADSIITSRLLVLQSKRLMLHSAQRRLDQRRVEELRAQAESAQHAYRKAMFSYGSPRDHDYWVIAYGRLIEMGRVLTLKLREAGNSDQVSPDLEMLEGMVTQWGRSMRIAMAGGGLKA